MKKGKKIVLAAAVLAAVAIVSSLTTLAVTNYGSQDDPLVTLSYLNETVTPAIQDRLNEILDQRLEELAQELGKLGGFPGETEGPQAPGFVVLTLNAGQTVTCGVGTEIMLRIGSASSAGAEIPRLIDESTGESVFDAGIPLTVNHMYMVTIKENGVMATSDYTKILIRGEYTVQ